MLSSLFSLQGKFKVRGICRDESKAKSFFKDLDVKIYEGNVRDRDSLISGLTDASVVVVIQIAHFHFENLHPYRYAQAHQHIQQSYGRVVTHRMQLIKTEC